MKQAGQDETAKTGEEGLGAEQDGRRHPSSRTRDHYRRLVDSLPGTTVVEVDPDGRLLYVSAAAAGLLGGNIESMLERVHPRDRQQVREALSRSFVSEDTVTIVFWTRGFDDEYIWVESSGRSYWDEEGNQRVVLVMHDISERITAELALQESEDRFRSLAENASDLIIELDEAGRVLYASPNHKELIGQSADEVVGTKIGEGNMRLHRVAASDRQDEGIDVLEAFHHTLAQKGQGDLMTYPFEHPDGSTRWFERRAKSFTARDGSPRVVVISRDVTKRANAERQLRLSEERYRIVANMSRDIIFESSEDGIIRYASPTIEEVLGVTPEEMVGTSAFDLVHPEDDESVQSAFARAIETNQPAAFPTTRIRHKDGSWLYMEGSGIPYQRGDGVAHLIVLARDVTQRRLRDQEHREFEAQVRQAQKLEGLGVMAGGIAHDFNNFLTPILGEAMLLLDEIADDDPARSRVNKIRAASQRAALLTSQMLAYAGKSTLAKSNIDLSHLVGEMAELMESGTGHGAIFKSALQTGLPPIQADPAQITQVVMNLITNASEAAGDKRGEIRIETGLVSIDSLNRSQLVLGSDLKGSEYVYVEVQDNGAGMTPGIQARIFDPFFTTKFAGRGLGLAAVLGIVRSHHGALEIDSGPQRGTRFRVLFPAAEGEIDVPVATAGLSKTWRGKGTILIVDDDDGVIDLMRETLQRAGLSVLTAMDGQAGIQAFSEHADKIDLVLLDRTMPTTSGEDACLAMREIRPDVPIVLVSGYSEERAAEHFQGPDLAGFLQKPFLPEELIDRVRSALER